MPSILNSDDGVVSGTSGLKTTGGNDGITVFQQNGTESGRITAAGLVGLGTSSPVSGNSRLTVTTGITAQDSTTPALQLYNPSAGSDQKYLRIVSTTTGTFNFEKVNDAYSSATGLFGVTTAGLFQFNSGYGSVATAYGCRAWVNFNGTGTVAIRASGNVSSITDNGTGQYTVNFATAMPDTNYATIGSGYTASAGNPAFTNATRAIVAFSNNSSSCRIQLYRSDLNGFDADSPEMNVAVFR